MVNTQNQKNQLTILESAPIIITTLGTLTSSNNKNCPKFIQILIISGRLPQYFFQSLVLIHPTAATDLRICSEKSVPPDLKAYSNPSASSGPHGISSLDLQLEGEAEFTRITRLRVSNYSYFTPMSSTKCSNYQIPYYKKELVFVQQMTLRVRHIFFQTAIKQKMEQWQIFVSINLIHTLFHGAQGLIRWTRFSKRALCCVSGDSIGRR